MRYKKTGRPAHTASKSRRLGYLQHIGCCFNKRCYLFSLATNLSDNKISRLILVSIIAAEVVNLVQAHATVSNSIHVTQKYANYTHSNCDSPV